MSKSLPCTKQQGNCFVELLSNTSGIAIGILAMPTAIVNALVMISFIATKQVNSNTTNFLIFWISTVDLLNGAIGMPLFSAAILGPNYIRNSLTWQFVAIGIPLTLSHWSGCITLITAIDRYLHMNPNIAETSPKLEKIFKKPRVYFLVLIIGLISVVYVALGFLGRQSDAKVFEITRLISSQLAVLGVMFVSALYVNAYMRIRRFVSENHLIYSNRCDGAKENPTDNQSTTTKQPLYVRRLFKTVLMLIIAMFVGCVPFCVVSTVVIGYQLSNAAVSDVILASYAVASVLFSSTFFTNAIIILYRNKEARAWLASKTFCACNKRSRDGNSAEVYVNKNIDSNTASVVELRRKRGLEN